MPLGFLFHWCCSDALPLTWVLCRSVVRNRHGFVSAPSPAVSNASVPYYARQVAVRATASAAAEEETAGGKKVVCVCVKPKDRKVVRHWLLKEAKLSWSMSEDFLKGKKTPLLLFA